MLMKYKNMQLIFNKRNGNYEITHKGFSWVSDGRKPYIEIRKKFGDKYIKTVRHLNTAMKKSTEISGNKAVTRYSGFIAFGRKLPFTIICTAEITDENSVTFSIKAENETGYDIQAAYFPAPFNSKKKGKNSYHVDPMRQGFILPDGYKNNFSTVF